MGFVILKNIYSIIYYKNTLKSFEDILEPDTDDEKRFNLSIKQLNFIQKDNNVKFMTNIMKSMNKYKLEMNDINDIIEKHIQNEQKRIERNETRRIKKQGEKPNHNDNDCEDDIKSILSNNSSNKNDKRSKRSGSRKRK